MTFPNLPVDFPPPQISLEAPGTRNLPSEFSEREDRRLTKKKESKRITTLDRAGQSAFARLNDITGDNEDRDVQFYSGLTQADMGSLMPAGCEHKFTSLEAAIKDYVGYLKDGKRL